jgi:hypothetical protein
MIDLYAKEEIGTRNFVGLPPISCWNGWSSCVADGGAVLERMVELSLRTEEQSSKGTRSGRFPQKIVRLADDPWENCQVS